jgi:VanZ family protein
MEYALLGVLTLNALRRSFRTQAWKPLMFWAWIFACLYGLSDEIHQSFVPERFMEAGDFIADCLGALGGIFGLRLASKGIGGLKR